MEVRERKEEWKCCDYEKWKIAKEVERETWNMGECRLGKGGEGKGRKEGDTGRGERGGRSRLRRGKAVNG